MKLKVDQYAFYNVGCVAFFIMAVMNLATLLQTWNSYLYLTAQISQIASVCFNFLILGFFWYLRSTLPPKGMTLATNKEMEAILKGGKTKK